MTEAELKSIEIVARQPAFIESADDILPVNDVLRLVAEVRRLRGLVKSAEWFSGIGAYHSEMGCPWCESDGFYDSSQLGRGRHQPDCPAFHPNGDVR